MSPVIICWNMLAIAFEIIKTHYYSRPFNQNTIMQYQHIGNVTWWRHQMETFSALLALCAGNSPVPVNSPHEGQWGGALIFSLICARIYDCVNNREAGDLRGHRGHYHVNVMKHMLFDIFVKQAYGNVWLLVFSLHKVCVILMLKLFLITIL